MMFQIVVEIEDMVSGNILQPEAWVTNNSRDLVVLG